MSAAGSLLQRWLWLILLLALPVAAQPLQIRELAVLADPQGRETLASVSAPARQRDFRPLVGGLAAGYTRRVHWLRFRVDVPASGGEVWLELQPPYLDDLRLYAPERAGAALQERRAGDSRPQRADGRRELASTGFVFRLDAEAVAGRTLWLRLETGSSSLLLLSARTPAEFAAANGLRLGAFGLYYGLLLALCAFCFWQGLWRRDLLHRAYLLSLLSLLLLMSCINGLHILWLPEAWAGLADQATSYATLLSGLASNWFYRHALELRRDGPGRWIWWLNRLALYAYGLGLLAPALGLYTEVAGALFQLTLLTTLVGFGRSLWLWRAGRPGSRLLALAHLISLSGVFTILLVLLGAVPGQLWLLYSSQIGSLLTMAAFGRVVLLRRQGLEAAHREASERAERAQREHAQERAARREQSRFIAMLSHEIRTPLSMIAGAAQALQKLVPGASEEVERRHQRIRRGVDGIERLLQQLLDQDRLDDEQFGLRRSRFDAAALCTELAEASEGQVRLRLDLPVDAPQLHADRTLLATALGNLLGNALKYSPAEVGLSLRADGGRVEFAVSDRGAGIAPALAARLFERYTRGPAVAGVAGSGLGLYLVRRIAGLHGGQVRLAARPGGGSVFLLSLPLEGEP